jgi:hypothetical protein
MRLPRPVVAAVTTSPSSQTFLHQGRVCVQVRPPRSSGTIHSEGSSTTWLLIATPPSTPKRCENAEDVQL